MAGAAVGWGIGGTFMGMSSASWGWLAGSFVGNALFAPSTPDINQEGPRLGDLKVQVSTYGNPIPTTYGSIRLAGNCIWSKPILETTHSSTQSSGGGKGGGGGGSVTTTTYSYSQSFAIAICDGPIIGIRRIWANGKIIYNTSDDASLSTAQASQVLADGIRFYSGSELQQPDSLIQSDVGAANCPAHRGTAYVVFENLQLADYGNRMPNLEFEVVKVTAAPLTEVSSIATGSPDAYGEGMVVSGKYLYISGYSGGPFKIFDITDPASPVFKGSVALNAAQCVVVRGQYAYLTGNLNKLTIIDVSDPTTPIVKSSTAIGAQGWTIVLNGNYLYYGAAAWPWMQVFDISDPVNPLTVGGLIPITNGFNHAVAYKQYFYALLYPSSAITVWSMATPTLPAQINSVSCAASIYGGNISIWGSCLYYADAGSPGKVYIYSLANPALPVLINTVTTVGTFPQKAILNQAGSRMYVSMYGSNSIEVYDSADPTNPIYISSVTTVNSAGAIQESFGVVYSINSANNLKIFTAGNTVGAAVSDICTRAGLQLADIDTSALTDVLSGYVVQRSTARSQIEQLMRAFFFDAVESSGKVKFIVRGGAPALTILEDDLAAHVDSSPVPDNLVTNMQQELELPLSVDLQFLDTSNAYQIGTQSAKRKTTVSSNRVSYNLAIAMSPSKGKQVADVLIYDAWTSRLTYEVQTGRAHSFLEPTDVINVVKGLRTYLARIVDESRDIGVTTFSLVQEASDVYTQSAVAASSRAPIDDVSFIPQTALYLLDIPILRDADSGVGFYGVARGFSSQGYSVAGWRGAQIYRSVDGGSAWDPFGRTVLNKSAIGTLTNTLGNFLGGNIFDEINTVVVRMFTEQLYGTTELGVLNGGNIALVGNEIIQFRDALLISSNTYRLTGLLRARQGTDQYVVNHAASETFILLSSTTTYIFASASSEYNLARLFKGASLNGFLDDATATSFTNTAIGLKPYSAVALSGGRNAALDVTLTWIRRTRISGAWLDNADVPLGEATEAYEVEIYSSSAYTVLKRTITSITNQSTIYTAAQQTTDFGSTQSTVYFKVFQLSATVGRGFEARGSA